MKQQWHKMLRSCVLSICVNAHLLHPIHPSPSRHESPVIRKVRHKETLQNHFNSVKGALNLSLSPRFLLSSFQELEKRVTSVTSPPKCKAFGAHYEAMSPHEFDIFHNTHS